MKKIVIVEDEAIAADHLQRLISLTMPDTTVVAVLQSIEESIEHFSHNPPPDLVFMDIHLADGLAFHIFDSVPVPCPIIYTTAYDQYALQAFNANGIDYLLKPIDADGLRHAMHKLNILSRQPHAPTPDTPHSQTPQTKYRSHFLIPVRDKLIPIQVCQIACLYLEDKITRALLLNGRRQIFDHPLDTIMEQLDPNHFFRANRQYIVAHNAIQEISVWPIGKLALTLAVDTPGRIIVSKAKAPEFKQWYSHTQTVEN